MEIIRKQFLDLLKKYHVVEIDALGKHFDPAFHEALSKEERPGISQAGGGGDLSERVYLQ